MFKQFTELDEDSFQQLSYDIVEIFEDYLDSINLDIPCSDPDEEHQRKSDSNTARLYGEEYWDLISDVETWIDRYPLQGDIFPVYFLSSFNKLLTQKGLDKYKPTGEIRKKLISNINSLLVEPEENKTTNVQEV